MSIPFDLALPFRGTGRRRTVITRSDMRHEIRLLRHELDGAGLLIEGLRLDRDTVAAERDTALATAARVDEAEQRAADAEQAMVEQTAELRELRAYRARMNAISVSAPTRDVSDGLDQATEPIDRQALRERMAQGWLATGPVVTLHDAPFAITDPAWPGGAA